MNIVEIICQRARQYGDKRALIQGERTVSYSVFAAGVEKVADELGRMGLRGSHVALRVSNSIEDLILALGVILAGHALVALPPEATDAEIRQHLACCNAAIMLHAEGASFVFEQLSDSAESPGEGIAFIRPTSGTTGRGKGVMLSHACIAARLASTSSMLALSADDFILWTLPVHLHFASSILLYLSAGVTVLLSDAVQPARMLQSMEQHRVTLLYGSPWQYRCLAGDRSLQKMPSVRLAISTGQPLSRQVAERFAARFERPLRQAYGVIEAGLVSMNVACPPDPVESAGHVAPGVSVTVIDENGRALSEGRIGEVRIAGPTLFSGYVHAADGHGRIDRAGAFISEDMGTLEGDVITLHGRKSSMINVAGLKVFPEEVENILDGHPSIRKARVYGVPDSRMGQIVAAEIIFFPGSALPLPDVIRYCRAYLSPHKIPLKIEAVQSLPTTQSGKIQRIP